MKEVKVMIKKIAWETFKNTGDINTFMELKQIEDIEKGIEGRSLFSKNELQVSNALMDKDIFKN